MPTLLAAGFDQLRDTPILRGVVAIGLGMRYVASAFYNRTMPATTMKQRLDRAAYWFGRIFGAAAVGIGIVFVLVDVVSL